MQNLSQLANTPSLNPDSSGLRGAMREITETATPPRLANPDLSGLFEAQAARTPEATAVVFGNAQLSYRELNARANQLARFLRTSWQAPPRQRGGVGVGLDARPHLSPNPSPQAERGSHSVWARPTETGAARLVGICLERSIEMVVAVLATLKAGAAYLRVLDEDLQPVADGETGQLFIGGDGVARGYLNREELTRERFVTNPFAQGEKLYRTGDLARQHQGGSLEYIGRVDDQVKIRGYRIEPGEIETVLKQHATVSDCAVVVSETAADEKRLVAFIENDGSAQWDEEALRQSVQAKLPEYMLPAAFVRLASLPLTVNGKVDRQALASQTPTPTSNEDFVAPRTPAERTLAGIWSDVLKVDRVSVNDNFFDLGGDSILGTLILARAVRAGLKLSPVLLFEHQTIAELAAVAVSAN
jgi:non-ribosomal peptide synthetase component F